MGTDLTGFFNKDLDKSIGSRRTTKRRNKKQKKVARFQNVLKKVRQHLGLHDYSTMVGICLAIHQETTWPVPGDEDGYRRYINKYYRKIRNRRRERKAKSDDDFYKSQTWRELRFAALRLSDGRCLLCGARASDGVRLQVDHIKPRSKYPEYERDLDNLQVLCEDCNYGKSNYDETDFRNW